MNKMWRSLSSKFGRNIFSRFVSECEQTDIRNWMPYLCHDYHIIITTTTAAAAATTTTPTTTTTTTTTTTACTTTNIDNMSISCNKLFADSDSQIVLLRVSYRQATFIAIHFHLLLKLSQRFSGHHVTSCCFEFLHHHRHHHRHHLNYRTKVITTYSLPASNLKSHSNHFTTSRQNNCSNTLECSCAE